MFEEIMESTAQKEKFRTAANKLLNQCFLLRRREDTKKEYVYVRQNRELFVPFLTCWDMSFGSTRTRE